MLSHWSFVESLEGALYCTPNSWCWKRNHRHVRGNPPPVSDMPWHFHMVVSINGEPPNGWFIIENPIKMDDLGVPLFQETPICLEHIPFRLTRVGAPEKHHHSLFSGPESFVAQLEVPDLRSALVGPELAMVKLSLVRPWLQFSHPVCMDNHGFKHWKPLEGPTR